MNEKITLKQLWYLIKDQAYCIYKDNFEPENFITDWANENDIQNNEYYNNCFVEEIYPDCDEQLFVLIKNK